MNPHRELRFQDKTLVSVVIPVYNGDPYLAEAIESVVSQSYRPLEILLVDDGSSDCSARIADRVSHHIRVLTQKNAGAASARNLGVRHAQGAFLAFLDQDDIWLKDKLRLQMQVVSRMPEVESVFGHVEQFYTPREGRHTQDCSGPTSRFLPGCLPSAMLIRRDAFLRVGYFDNRWQIAEWADWYVRGVAAGLRMEMLPDTVARRRVHGGNHGLAQRQFRYEYARVLKAFLDRRRLALYASPSPIQ